MSVVVHQDYVTSAWKWCVGTRKIIYLYVCGASVFILSAELITKYL